MTTTTIRRRRRRRSGKERGTYCFLTVDYAANAELNLHPRPAGVAGPHRLADIAAALLTGQPGHGPRHRETGGRDLLLKGISGMDLRHRRFDITLSVFPDDRYFDVAEISAAAPRSGTDSGDTGTVHLADDGILRWKRSYQPGRAQTRHTPSPARLPGPADVAASTAGTVTAAVRTARPASPAPTRKEAA